MQKGEEDIRTLHPDLIFILDLSHSLSLSLCLTLPRQPEVACSNSSVLLTYTVLYVPLMRCATASTSPVYSLFLLILFFFFDILFPLVLDIVSLAPSSGFDPSVFLLNLTIAHSFVASPLHLEPTIDLCLYRTAHPLAPLSNCK